ncbi:hypothetical protein [Phenylobacterium sp.]|uniref:hypothetical protein n=1 Tax=Phenylobacterium sp. TaxID=1871053 RepID=UPI0035B3D0DF
MAEDTRSILVTFPAPVEISREIERALHDLVHTICKGYEAGHPGRVMWVAGFGGLITSMPITAEDEAAGVPLSFDMSVLSIDCAEREDYDWLCAKCGLKQGDHESCIVDPPAGDCAFEPAERNAVRAHPHLTEVQEQRQWLAKQLLDERLTDAEAYGVVAFHPSVKDAWTKPTAEERAAEGAGVGGAARARGDA